MRKAEGEVEPVAEDAIASLPPDEPITYSVEVAEQVDLGRFREPAAQAAAHERRLVIVVDGET